MLDAADADEHLIEVPPVTEPRPPLAHLVGVGLAELGALPPDRLVADRDTAFEHEFLDFTEAEREPPLESVVCLPDGAGTPGHASNFVSTARWPRRVAEVPRRC